eukprot:GFUD01037362.1.p1 GENE.GFUD01037362.1~~GFUD01037362.1.p1  ORF type:complete len:110 (+),score=13.99 GFUD01037362.1:53-382(+)
MSAIRRLQKELGDLKNSGNKSFRNVQVDETNLLVWHGQLIPDKAPYNKVAFLVDLVLPAEYRHSRFPLGPRFTNLTLTRMVRCVFPSSQQRSESLPQRLSRFSSLCPVW